MNDAQENATVTQTSRLSRVWLIPLVAMIIGLWMVYYQWQNQGPTIILEMPSAAGIEVNKTPIKVRDLEVGVVKKIELMPNLDGILVHARMDASVSHLVTDTAKFWLVTPRISLSEVSGLNTLLSGSYIAMAADGLGQETTRYVALDRPPVTPPGTPGLHLTLTSFEDLAFKPGDPIVFKGFKVGEFEEAKFNIDERVVYYTAFIEAPHHQLVTRNTRFWNISGVKLNLESSGVSVETGSLETLLTNGITFDIPPDMAPGPLAESNALYTIYPNRKTAHNERFTQAAEYVLLVDDSVRGLTTGAPVEYRGIEIGEVKSIYELSTPDEDNDILNADYPIPVVIKIFPGMVLKQDTEEALDFVQQHMQEWIERDLRATLRMGNVLTGGLYIDLQHHSDASDTPIETYRGLVVIPTVSSEFTQLTQKADAILNKLNELPLEGMIGDIRDMVATLKLAAQSVNNSSNTIASVASDVDAEQINQRVNQVLDEVTRLLAKYSEGGLNPQKIQRTLDTLEETLRGFQPLLLQLNKSPNSLVFPANQEHLVIPKAQPQQGASNE